MKTFLQFILFMAMAAVVILMAIVLGELGAWYFAWLVGTGMIVLITAAGGALLDAQDEHAAHAASIKTGDA
ncbi:hypothetical protein EAH75_09385 [Rhodanobacter glycinis]|uniref:Cyd operon protein YbgT n=1 Tax=Rhodanobacter glycinis TaxID=582702 RepID=A0A502FHG8_9GAMM|nr:hypothetical protein [Rhodanobacter glycinis]TPG11154.1 hypothetical protein EAH88_00955 [Rhodanobacter glycinis]TPG48643.1 hypothetical protein EAH75_09385 [Rhodanobacter glycinis]